jgi:SNF2 family DNA or RNA helicase
MSDDSTTVFRFDGTVAPKLREAVKTSFNQSVGFTVMLVTAGCGGAGLNLASASHVVLLEPWWRLSDERQAIARAYRQGQDKEVHVWRIVGVDSVVDGVLKGLQTRKAVVADDIMAELCRPDGVAPVVPYQDPLKAGELLVLGMLPSPENLWHVGEHTRE